MVNSNNFILKWGYMEYDIDIKWMDEVIEKVPGWQGKYKLLCIMLFKKRLTYSNMYVLSYALNKSKFKGNEDALKEKIIKDLAIIYHYNNNKLPIGFNFNTSKE